MKEDNRKFDWGPPQKGSDRFRDFSIYLLIVLILGIGIWVLSGIRLSNKKNIVSPDIAVSAPNDVNYEEAPSVVIRGDLHNIVSSKSVEKSSESGALSVSKVPDLEIVYTNSAKHYVQLGAFEDESSALEVMEFLKENDFLPVLKAPDKQFEIYRVLVGPFDSEADADYRAEKLNDLGLPSFVVEY